MGPGRDFLDSNNYAMVKHGEDMNGTNAHICNQKKGEHSEHMTIHSSIVVNYLR